jgi:hypothetical protein
MLININSNPQESETFYRIQKFLSFGSGKITGSAGNPYNGRPFDSTRRSRNATTGSAGTTTPRISTYVPVPMQFSFKSHEETFIFIYVL